MDDAGRTLQDCLDKFEPGPQLLDVRRLRLQPGDTLVVKLAGGHTAEVLARTEQLLRKIVGDTPIIVLDDGADLSVLASEKAEA